MKTRNTNNPVIIRTESSSTRLSNAKNLNTFACAIRSFTSFRMTIITLLSVLCSLYSCNSEDEVPSNDSRTVTVQLHANAKPMFVEGTESRTTTGAWETGDEVVAMIKVGNYFSFATLQCTGNDTWKVTDNYVTQYGSQASDPYYNYHLLAKTEGFSLNEISVRLPEDVPTGAEVQVMLTYAPEQVLITEDKEGNKTMGLEFRDGAMTTAIEEWIYNSTKDSGWNTTLARIRIHTGVPDQVVTMDSDRAKTNANGDAYFYTLNIDGDIKLGETVLYYKEHSMDLEPGKAYLLDVSATINNSKQQQQ